MAPKAAAGPVGVHRSYAARRAELEAARATLQTLYEQLGPMMATFQRVTDSDEPVPIQASTR